MTISTDYSRVVNHQDYDPWELRQKLNDAIFHAESNYLYAVANASVFDPPVIQSRAKWVAALKLAVEILDRYISEKKIDEAKVYSLDTTLDFGQYRGQTVREVLNHNSKYLIWMKDHVPRFKIDAELVEALEAAQATPRYNRARRWGSWDDDSHWEQDGYEDDWGSW